MESAPRTEIKVFDYDHGPKDTGIRRYIWLEEHDYVVVLQAKKAVFFWVTGYYLNSPGRRADLERRYASRV